MLVSYNWLQEYLGKEAPTPAQVADLLGQHAFEIEDISERDGDTVIDVDVLPNRSSDCLCHRGIAREVASITGTPLVYDPLQNDVAIAPTEIISVAIADGDICPRFTATIITGIEVKESPAWLQKHLSAIGQRSINNIVDATNYVMFALGQPLHAYDADLFSQVEGTWQFGVRYAQPGETVSLLAEGGKDEDRIIELTGSEVLVVDDSSNTPIGLAGVKGGRFAGVHAGTTKVIIEAAHWNPIITRKTARGLGIVIDASKRFENEPSRALPPYAQAEICKLITDIAGGVCEGMVDVYPEPLVIPEVTVAPTRVNALLGLELSSDTMTKLLQQTGISVTEEDTDRLLCQGPIERMDLTIEEDFIEEIGRLYGYDHVAAVVPETVPLSELNARHYYSERIREKLMNLGFSEVITSSFRKKDDVALYNALASDKGCMRYDLASNLAEALDKNAGFADLLGNRDTRIFEIGTVFEKGGDFGVTEHVSLALGVRTKVGGYSKKDEAILNEVIAELKSELPTEVAFKVNEGVAELNVTELIARLPAPTAYQSVELASEKPYRAFFIYPHMSRDIALWVPESTTIAAIETVLNEQAGPLRVRTTLFDEFSKDGRTSYAFRLVFQSSEKTLTDEEVNVVMEGVYEAATKHGWEVR